MQSSLTGLRIPFSSKSMSNFGLLEFSVVSKNVHNYSEGLLKHSFLFKCMLLRGWTLFIYFKQNYILQQMECRSNENLTIFYQARHVSDLQKCKMTSLFLLHFLLENVIFFHKRLCYFYHYVIGLSLLFKNKLNYFYISEFSFLSISVDMIHINQSSLGVLKFFNVMGNLRYLQY